MTLLGQETLSSYRIHNVTPHREAVKAMDIWGAMFRQEYWPEPVKQKLVDWWNEPKPIDKNFNLYDSIIGTEWEDHYSAFIGANSQYQVETIKRNLQQEWKDRDTIARGGIHSVVSMLATGILDPINFIPVGAAYKGVKTFRAGFKVGIMTGAPAIAATEGLLYASQETRTKDEVAYGIGFGTLFAGLLSGGITKLASGSSTDILDRLAIIKKSAEDDFTDAASISKAVSEPPAPSAVTPEVPEPPAPKLFEKELNDIGLHRYDPANPDEWLFGHTGVKAIQFENGDIWYGKDMTKWSTHASIYQSLEDAGYPVENIKNDSMFFDDGILYNNIEEYKASNKTKPETAEPLFEIGENETGFILKKDGKQFLPKQEGMSYGSVDQVEELMNEYILALEKSGEIKPKEIEKVIYTPASFDKKYGGTGTGVDVEGANAEELQGIGDTLDHMIRKFPKLKRIIKDKKVIIEIKENVVHDSKGNVGGQYSDRKTNIEISRKSGLDNLHILSHEMGHHFAFTQLSKAEKKKIRDFYDVIGKKRIEEEVGSYAATNSEEMFAEMFAYYTNPGYGKRKYGTTKGTIENYRFAKDIEDFLEDLLRVDIDVVIKEPKGK